MYLNVKVADGVAVQVQPDQALLMLEAEGRDRFDRVRAEIENL